MSEGAARTGPERKGDEGGHRGSRIFAMLNITDIPLSIPIPIPIPCPASLTVPAPMTTTITITILITITVNITGAVIEEGTVD